MMGNLKMKEKSMEADVELEKRFADAVKVCGPATTEHRPMVSLLS